MAKREKTHFVEHNFDDELEVVEYDHEFHNLDSTYVKFVGNEDECKKYSKENQHLYDFYDDEEV